MGGALPDRAAARPKVVALGGGHGLHAMLSALVRLPVEVTAVVTVADDGGSSGRLRHEMPGIVPPGDLRMALTALADPGEHGALWSSTFQHRFRGEGALAGHPVGNLVLVGLTKVLGGDPVAALDAAGALLGSRGRVLPMACQPLDIVAEVTGLDEDPAAVRRIRGQVAVASTPGRVRSVALDPPDAAACPEALKAVAEADLITLGPGSWFTSVLPHLMLPDLAAAILASRAAKVVVLNLAAQAGETEGFSPEQHLDVLSDHAPELAIDSVLADRASVALPQRLATAAARLGARLDLDDVAIPGTARHDPAGLAASLAAVLARDGSPGADGRPDRPGGLT
ncbi:gluconeogenesis factor YvcK family protein [Nakamurella sp.]|uniref:gluconeogenesis factor YvcK family protein n=1 Tax=Nakamurella sp. TaxID=1869182 RepID=UPI003B39FEF9